MGYDTYIRGYITLSEGALAPGKLPEALKAKLGEISCWCGGAEIENGMLTWQDSYRRVDIIEDMKALLRLLSTDSQVLDFDIYWSGEEDDDRGEIRRGPGGEMEIYFYEPVLKHTITL